MNRASDIFSWTESLSRRFTERGVTSLSPEERGMASRSERIRLVALVRWALLVVLALYAALAASTYMLSSYGFFLTTEQLVLLGVIVAAVVVYNLACHLKSDLLAGFRISSHFQILLDLLAVTALIHCSGGASSWFWPMYMIVTLEAAYLLDSQREVWMLGVVGWGLYCLLIVAEYFEFVRSVKMPFVEAGLLHDGHFVLLIALWVLITNTVTAIIANFLMSVIRRENSLVRENEERLLAFIDNANDLIHCITPEGVIVFMNSAMKNLIGTLDDAAGAIGFLDLVTANTQEVAVRELNRNLSGKKPESCELAFKGEGGQEIWVEGNLTCSFKDGQPSLLWGIWRDESEKKRSQERLFSLAHNDNLTGLPNRILFRDRLRQSIAYANRLKRYCALLFLDLDRFKIINDSLGHPVGDKLLQAVAKALLSSVREVDTVARFGGDEFTIVVSNLERPVDVEVVAAKVLDSLQKPFLIDGHELFAMASVGISIYPEHGEDIDALIKKADIAMYEAKGQGGDRFLVYDPVMDQNSHKRLLLENGLRKALSRNEFRLVYQPKVDLVSGQITAVEALIRWDHPEFGLVRPDEFIPLAEETGIIVAIGEWVLDRACRQNMEWADQGVAQLRVAVNISGFHLQQPDFVTRLEKIVTATGMPFELLEIEITESVIMQNPDFTINVLNQIQAMGINISVDDFGTGYSSLAHLKRFSVNTLKIDKSFVRDLESNQTDAAITSAIIAMGNSLNLKVIAEGVETEGQYTFLQEAMCDEIQGYLISRPIPPERVAGFINSRGWMVRKRSK